MDFGKVDSEEDLNAVDFSLPPDPAGTKKMLKENKSDAPTKVYVGCAKWGRKDWVGKIYPPKSKESDFLKLYAERFNCIELNSFFYKMPTVAQTTGWREKVGSDFMFVPKFAGQITHIRRLKNTEELVDRFFKGIAGFGNTLGPLFLMPHPQMGPKSLETQEAFIDSLPKDISLFVEQRHAGWYADPEAFEAMCALLEKNKAGFIITDAAGRRDCVHMRLTTPDAFIRFTGNSLHPTDYTRIDEWVQRIKSWMKQGIRNVYFFMHHHEELHSPELCRYLVQQLNKHCKTSIPVPEFVS